MPDERTYYVLCDDNCRFEGMTKEQIIEAIAEATGATPTHIDDAFITKLKEQNANKALKFWLGTTAQYNAIEEPEENVFYILTDENFADDVDAEIEALRDEINGIYEQFMNVTRQTITDLPTGVTGEVRLEKTGRVVVCSFELLIADNLTGETIQIYLPEGFRPTVDNNEFYGFAEIYETIGDTVISSTMPTIKQTSGTPILWVLSVENRDTHGRNVRIIGSITYIA